MTDLLAYIRTITPYENRTSIDLHEFYGKPLDPNEHYAQRKDPVNLYVLTDFKKVLAETTADGVFDSAPPKRFYVYESERPAVDADIMSMLDESPMDLSTAEGRAEGRARLDMVARSILNIPKGRQGDLLADEYFNVIGWFKLASGAVWALALSNDLGLRFWKCMACSPVTDRSRDRYAYAIRARWPARSRFFSRDPQIF